MPSGNELKKWYEDALNDLIEANSTLSEAQQQVNMLEQKVKSLESLFILEGGDITKIVIPEDLRQKDVVDSAVKIIEDNGGSMHIGEIRRKLLEAGMPLPGKGTDANLIAKFQRSNGRIVRVGRGLYDIAR